MGAENLKPMTPLPGAVIVRRVLRMEQSFVCGICRSHHDEMNTANECISNCWNLLQHKSPVTALRRIGRIEFGCVYCLRTYRTFVLANNCANDCVTNLSITDFNGDIKVQKRKHNLWFNGGTVAVSAAAMSDAAARAKMESLLAEPVDKPKSEPTQQTTAPAPAAPAAAKEESAEDADAAAKARKAPRDRTKKFERHGSKYVCIVCNNKFFTKEEVEACFDGHE